MEAFDQDVQFSGVIGDTSVSWGTLKERGLRTPSWVCVENGRERIVVADLSVHAIHICNELGRLVCAHSL